MSKFRPVSESAYRAMLKALRGAAGLDQRFDGTPEQQAALADQMAALLDEEPTGGDVVWLKKDDTLGLANDLRNAQPRFSPGQFAAALATLVKPEGV